MDYVGLGALLIGLVVFGFLTYRAIRARRRWVKFAGGIPVTLLALVFATAIVLALVGYRKVYAVRPNPVPQVSAPASAMAVSRGETIARTCAGCHASNG